MRSSLIMACKMSPIMKNEPVALQPYVQCNQEHHLQNQTDKTRTLYALGVCRGVCVLHMWMQSKTSWLHEQNSLRQQKKGYYTLKGDCSTSESPLPPQLPTRDIAIPNERQGEATLARVPTNLFYALQKEEIKENQSKNIVKSSNLWKILGKKFLEPLPNREKKAHNTHQV